MGILSVYANSVGISFLPRRQTSGEVVWFLSEIVKTASGFFAEELPLIRSSRAGSATLCESVRLASPGRYVFPLGFRPTNKAVKWKILVAKSPR
jgi:hypothetical protein